jgi:hypothetical protein
VSASAASPPAPSAVLRLAGGYGPSCVGFASLREQCSSTTGLRIDGSGLEIVGLVTSIEANTECVGECRIGAVAPMSDTLRVSGAKLVSASSRDRITVDMRGLKGALEARARQVGMAPSEFVRTTLADAVGSALLPKAQSIRA